MDHISYMRQRLVLARLSSRVAFRRPQPSPPSLCNGPAGADVRHPRCRALCGLLWRGPDTSCRGADFPGHKVLPRGLLRDDWLQARARFPGRPQVTPPPRVPLSTRPCLPPHISPGHRVAPVEALRSNTRKAWVTWRPPREADSARPRGLHLPAGRATTATRGRGLSRQPVATSRPC